MITIVYSFNKTGYEAEYWEREIAAASGGDFRFIPFNHQRYVDPALYWRAQLLDNLYFTRHQALMRLYEALESTIAKEHASALIVDNCPPYHPDYLRMKPWYKVLRTTDGPLSAYDRDFPYLHAYDHVLYHSPAYSRDLTMREKLAYCGARRADFWPLGLFDAMYDTSRSEETILNHTRDVDVVFVGALHVNKMPLLAKVKKALGRRCILRGLSSLKKNVYFNARFRFPGWVRPIRADAYVPLYQRAKIGINVHNRGDYTVGSYRLFELPANGVMQLSDGGEYLNAFFEVGKEIVGYRSADDLIDRLRYFLAHDEERSLIARAGFRRAVTAHRMRDRLHTAGRLVYAGLIEHRRGH